MHLTTPSNALSNFSLPGLPGRTSFVRYDFLEWDESAPDESLVAQLTNKGVPASGDLSEVKLQS